jgi:hypothetical protein
LVRLPNTLLLDSEYTHVSISIQMFRSST